MRRSIFEENLKHINKHNEEASKGLHSFDLGINQFADLSHAEFLAKMSPRKVERNHEKDDHQSLEPKDMPASVDWRKEVMRPS